jgi:hypothetical protein
VACQQRQVHRIAQRLVCLVPDSLEIVVAHIPTVAGCCESVGEAFRGVSQAIEDGAGDLCREPRGQLGAHVRDDLR